MSTTLDEFLTTLLEQSINTDIQEYKFGVDQGADEAVDELKEKPSC